MKPEPTNALLMRIKQHRCESSFTRLFNQYYNKVKNACYKRLRHVQDAEDATQATFAQLWENKIDAWDGNDGEQLIFGVAKFAALTMRSRRERQQADIYLDAVDENGNTFQLADPRAEYAETLNSECENEIDKVLLRSNSELRLIWILRRRENYSTEEVARITGLRKSWVTHQLRKMTLLMRAELMPFFKPILCADPTEAWEKIEARARFRRLFQPDAEAEEASLSFED